MNARLWGPCTLQSAQLVEGFEMEPSEVELREIAGELQREKAKA
jgi:hypothetical protein